MGFEPQKFFIGLIDFFSVLLPGALLTFLVRDELGPLLFGPLQYAMLEGATGGLVFLFASYLLGHFVFLVGAGCLDDYVYDPIRQATPKHQIERLATGRRPSWWSARFLARISFSSFADAAVAQVLAIRDAYLGRFQATNSVNAFQWCKARLALKHREALATVNRFEADSKFFRSLLVVLAIVFLWSAGRGVWWLHAVKDWCWTPLAIEAATRSAAALLLIPLALWRYVDQRGKATAQAYWFVITDEAENPAGVRSAPLAPVDPNTRAGGVVCRVRWWGSLHYLLVEAKDEPGVWVLPKGHIEPGEDPRQTAVREVCEEAGVWAKVLEGPFTVTYTERRKDKNKRRVKKGARLSVEFYLMERVANGRTKEKRKREWLPFDAAYEQATHRTSKSLLKRARDILEPQAAAPRAPAFG